MKELMGKILIIEDEEKIARFLELELEFEGYQVDKAFNGRDGLELAQTCPFDLILLDIMLPGLNGIEVLRRLRQFTDIPIILLTARDTVIDKVAGLDGGANDYVTKPFAIEELLARIRAALRKRAAKGSKPSSMLVSGVLTIDVLSREARVNNELIDLTKREFDVLHYLLLNKNIVIERETLLEKIWGYDFTGGTNAVDVYIRYLRAKIEEPFGLKFIYTVRGVGYMIKDE